MRGGVSKTKSVFNRRQKTRIRSSAKKCVQTVVTSFSYEQWTWIHGRSQDSYKGWAN